MRFVDAPGSTSSRVHPAVARIASAIASITARSRPSEKFGTHSTSFRMVTPVAGDMIIAACDSRVVVASMRWPRSGSLGRGGAGAAGGPDVPPARRADPRRAVPRRAAAGPRLPPEPRPRPAAPHVPPQRRAADHGEAVRRLGGAERRAARPQPRPLPDRLRAPVRGDRRRAAEGPRPRRSSRSCGRCSRRSPRAACTRATSPPSPRSSSTAWRPARASGRPTTRSTRSWPASSTCTGRPATRRRSRS